MTGTVDKLKKDKNPSDPPTPKGWNKRRALVVIVLFLVFLLELFGSTCFFSSVFGIPCAGCGSTRALALLLQGKLGEAIRMHPLILVSLAVLFAFLTVGILKLIAEKRGRKLPFSLPPRVLNLILFSLVALYLIVYLVRMILYFPHTEPMCYNYNSVWGRLITLIRRLLPAGR